MTGLTKTQARTMLRVAQMCESTEEVAHDHSGDLSMCSRNWPATHHSLVRRGLIDAHYDPQAFAEEAWTYTLTPLGKRAVMDLRGEA